MRLITLVVLAGLTLICFGTLYAGDKLAVKNYHEISDLVGTGGAVDVDGIKDLADQGYQVFVDLRTEYDEDEAKTAEAANIRYISVPTSSEEPESASLDRLFQVMRENEGQKILVHCAANHRASAMVYLYRVIVEDTDKDEAMRDVTAVWKPNKTWEKFMKSSMERHQSEREGTQL